MLGVSRDALPLGQLGIVLRLCALPSRGRRSLAAPLHFAPLAPPRKVALLPSPCGCAASPYGAMSLCKLRPAPSERSSR